MNTQARRVALVAAILWLGLGAGRLAEAGAMLRTPSGLSPSEHFRFAIVTDEGTTATSSTIADYNSFVNTQAGGATYNGNVVTWSAIASTDTVSAIGNVGQTQDPVYLVDGTKVTTSTTTSGLWSGDLLHPINLDVSGMLTSAGEVWTGTNPDGTGTAGFTLGNPTPLAGVGSPTRSDNGWVAIGSDLQGTSRVLYGISQDLIVSVPAIPEPASLWLLGTAMGEA